MKKLCGGSIIFGVSVIIVGCGGGDGSSSDTPSAESGLVMVTEPNDHFEPLSDRPIKLEPSAPVTFDQWRKAEKEKAAPPKIEINEFKVNVKDLGREPSSSYTDPDYADIFYGFHQITDQKASIVGWSSYSARGTNLEAKFRELLTHADKWNDFGAGSFVKRDAETAWSNGWNAAIEEGQWSKYLYLEVMIPRPLEQYQSRFESYDFDSKAFVIDIKSGTNKGDKVKSAVTFRDDYGFSFINYPSLIEVADENVAREIELAMQQGTLMLKAYGGVTGAKQMRGRFDSTMKLLLVQPHFSELYDSRSGELIHTF